MDTSSSLECVFVDGKYTHLVQRKGFTTRLSLEDLQALKYGNTLVSAQAWIDTIIDKLELTKSACVINDDERKSPGLTEALKYLSSIGFIVEKVNGRQHLRDCGFTDHQLSDVDDGYVVNRITIP